MARGRQELGWDLSNNVMVQILNSTRTLCNQLVAVNGGKPNKTPPVNFMDINPYRD